MQKRTLDQRPDFTLVTDQKVSSNYYPINSAIAFRDDTTQMTVMNDRSQGGAVIEDGAIELMQNRRLLFDDCRGVGEALNETDSEGRGIEVNAKYFVQIFDTTKASSLQRRTQLVVDEPIQYFFTTSFTESDAQCISCVANNALHESMKTQTNGFAGDLKIHLFPEAKNQILVRLDNLADLFDGTPQETPYFNLEAYVGKLYALSNGGAKPTSVTLTERTLGNNQDFSEWQKLKYQWKSESESNGADWPEDKEDEVALQPQRIRLYRVTFNATTEEHGEMTFTQ